MKCPYDEDCNEFRAEYECLPGDCPYDPENLCLKYGPESKCTPEEHGVK